MKNPKTVLEILSEVSEKRARRSIHLLRRERASLGGSLIPGERAEGEEMEAMIREIDR